MTNLRQLANHLAAQGRNGDSIMVHMQPVEVAALERLTGRKATTNPVTGQKEGFAFLIPLIASLLGSVGGAVASKVLAPKETKATTDESAAGNYIKARGKEALAKYDIPMIWQGPPQGAAQKGYTPGVDPERQLVPIRQPGYMGPDGTLQPRLGFAEGGEIPEQMQAQQVEQEAIAALMGEGQDPEGAINRYLEVFGEEALRALLMKVQGGQQMQQPDQGMARGGLLRGPGGGLDDLMTARTSSGQRIALGGGEHVTPADVVSMLGDGSTEAGSRKLTAMEQRVRMHKTGTPRQAGKIGNRVMPA